MANDEGQKLAQVWRAGRLLAGKTQAQLAQAIGIPQSSISKYETQTLEPSASDWFRFCQYVGIDAHKSLNLGYIDGKSKFKDKLYIESNFNLPIKYRRDFSLKIRELIPFKIAITSHQGEELWQEFLSTHKIENEMFSVYDFQVSATLFLDLVKWSEHKGIDLISAAAQISSDLSYHELLQLSLPAKTESRFFLKRLIEQQGHYQKVMNVELLTSESFAEMKLKFLPSILNFFNAESLARYRDYKAASINQLLTVNVPDFSGFDFTFTSHEVSLRTRI